MVIRDTVSLEKVRTSFSTSFFAQLDAVIAFDESLKSLLYSPLMQRETAIKSYVI